MLHPVRPQGALGSRRGGLWVGGGSSGASSSSLTADRTLLPGLEAELEAVSPLGGSHGTRRPDEPGGGRGGPGELLSAGNTHREPATDRAATRTDGGELPLPPDSTQNLKMSFRSLSGGYSVFIRNTMQDY